MGTQQVLLTVLSVVIVGATIAAGISMFESRSREANRRAIVQDMYNVATKAIAYYKTPVTQGGGGGDSFFMNRANFYQFTGLRHDDLYIYTSNGRIYILKLGQNYYVIGYGNEIGFDEEDAISGLLRISGKAEDPILTFIN